MKLWWTLAVAGMSGVWVGGVVLVERTAAQGQPSVIAKGNAGETFKNVSTSTLKGLGVDCADCHPNAGTDQVDWVIDTPPKRTARRMIEMVATINRTNFGGVQRVTCWTCHHGRDIPASTIALDSLYESPNAEREDIVKAEPGEPSA